MRKFKAFTMAEAILVMTILGIIATIMISTLKPAEFKDKGLAILAKKVLSEVDSATTQIQVNNSQNGQMHVLYVPGTATTYAFGSNLAATATLYKKYLTTIRKSCSTSTCPCNSYSQKFYLKDGACMGISATTSATATIFPGETTTTSVTPQRGVLFFDTNGEEEPNVQGKDQFILPVDNEGIKYGT